MNEHPQEWRPEFVESLVPQEWMDKASARSIADAHNAELAAERERANAAELEVEERGRTIIHYKQALIQTELERDAEREKVKALMAALKKIQAEPEVYSPAWNRIQKVCNDALAKVKEDLNEHKKDPTGSNLPRHVLD
jgi:hypothetical protein